MNTEPSSLPNVLASLNLQRVNAAFFVGDQLPAPDNHILGGHLGAQALMAAGHTAAGRSPPSARVCSTWPASSTACRCAASWTWRRRCRPG